MKVPELMAYSFKIGPQPDVWVETFLGATPDEWQRKVLCQLGKHIQSGISFDKAFRLAIASGHGIGKSTMAAWLILWGMGSRPLTRIIVTANSEGQLMSKTWPTVAQWYAKWKLKTFFTMTATKLYYNGHPDYERTWMAEALPNNPDRPESFQGLHNVGNRTLFLFDEASAIPYPIWEAVEGSLRDINTEIIFIAFGNPTRAEGEFYNCFHQNSGWRTQNIDSRTSAYVNKEAVEEFVRKWGEDSDVVKVRVRGLFPAKSGAGLFGEGDIDEAMHREQKVDDSYPWVMGVDIALDGGDASVFSFRKGNDFWSRPQMELRGLRVEYLVDRIVETMNRYDYRNVFIDATGLGKPIVQMVMEQSGVRNVRAVNFGDKADDEGMFLNKRAEMYYKAEEWIRNGGIMRKDETLKKELLSITNKEPDGNLKDQRLRLESKRDMRRRGLDSPDHADSFVLTFAYPVLAESSSVKNMKIKQDSWAKPGNLFRR